MELGHFISQEFVRLPLSVEARFLFEASLHLKCGRKVALKSVLHEYMGLPLSTNVPLSCLCHVPLMLLHGIANRHGLEFPAIESRWERGFPYPSTQVLRLIKSHVKLKAGLLPPRLWAY